MGDSVNLEVGNSSLGWEISRTSHIGYHLYSNIMHGKIYIYV